MRAGSGTVKVPDYWTAYHEYAVEWTPHKLTYFVDQKPYKSCEGPAPPSAWPLLLACCGPTYGAHPSDVASALFFAWQTRTRNSSR